MSRLVQAIKTLKSLKSLEKQSGNILDITTKISSQRTLIEMICIAESILPGYTNF